MAVPLRVLILEDEPADAELAVHALRQAGFEPDWTRVVTEEDYVRCLELSPDVILADHRLPQFDSVRALARLRERGLDVPFVIVSGAIGEDLAVGLMEQGAADFVVKDRLARLGPAVLRALERKRLRDEKRLAEQRLLASERRFRALIEHSSDGIILLSPEAVILYASPSTARILGYVPEELAGRNAFDFVHPEDIASIRTQFEDLKQSPGIVVSVMFPDVPAAARAGQVPRHGDGAGDLQAGGGAARRPDLGRVAAGRGEHLPLHPPGHRKQTLMTAGKTSGRTMRLLAELHHSRAARIRVAGGGAGAGGTPLVGSAPDAQASALGLPHGQPQPPPSVFPHHGIQRITVEFSGIVPRPGIDGVSALTPTVPLHTNPKRERGLTQVLAADMGKDPRSRFGLVGTAGRVGPLELSTCRSGSLGRSQFSGKSQNNGDLAGPARPLPRPARRS